MDNKNLNDMKNLNTIVEQIKNVENGVNGMIVPMLKDTIKDTNKHNTKLFILCIFELIVIAIIGIYAQFLVAKQNDKYSEFLNQFEYESDVYQEVTTDDAGDAIINDGIDIQK